MGRNPRTERLPLQPRPCAPAQPHRPLNSTASWPFRQLLLRPSRRYSVEHPFNTEVFVNIGPVYSVSIADDFKVASLRWCGFAQPPGPCQWHTDHAPIYKKEGNQLISDFDIFDPSICTNRNAHAMPPGSFPSSPEWLPECG